MNAPPRIIYLNAADLPAFDEPFNEYREPYILKSDYDALQANLTEAERLNKVLSDAVVTMADDGWLYHGVEGMSEAQQKCYDAYNAIKEIEGAMK